MRNFCIILLITTILGGFIACSDDNKNPNEKLFIGTWTSEAVYEENRPYLLASEIKFDFREDRTFTQTATIDFYSIFSGGYIKTVTDSILRHGTYSVDSKIFTLYHKKGTYESRSMYQYKFEEDNLIIKSVEYEFWVKYSK